MRGTDVAGVKILRDFLSQFTTVEKVQFAWVAKTLGPWPFAVPAAYEKLKLCMLEKVETESWVVEAFLLMHGQLESMLMKMSCIVGRVDGLDLGQEGCGGAVAVRLGGTERTVLSSRRSIAGLLGYSQDEMGLEERKASRSWGFEK